MINRNQNKLYNIGNNQNKRIGFPQNKQMNIVNQISKVTNNSQKKPLVSNNILNNRNIRNNNIVQNQNFLTNNNNENDELSKALIMIRRELKRKDDRILELEKKVMELTKELNSLTNDKSNTNNNNITSNITPFKSTSKGEYNGDEDNKIGIDINQGDANLGYTGINNIINLGKYRNNNIIRAISPNNTNYNSDNENLSKRHPGYDNLSHSNDNSVLTYNGTNNKREVKKYLQEVKSKIEPKKFKDFIRNIKLLTAKNNSTLNKNIIVETVRMIFGEEHKDLFIRFQAIIGAGK